MKALAGSPPLFALIAATVLLRAFGLDSGLWYDEIWTLVDFGRLDFSTLVTTFGSDNNHPLFTLLAWLSLHVFGESAWALRLPAMVFGVLSVVMLHRFAVRVAPPTEALLATALLAFSYHHVWFSQNARGYTALLFFTIAAVHFFLRALDGEDRRAWWLSGLALALATYTHLTGVFVAIAMAAVWVLAATRRVPAHDLRRPLYALLLAPAVSLVLHAPILVEMVGFILGPKEEETRAKVEAEWTNPWWTVTAVAESLGIGLLPGLAVLAGAGLVLVVGTWSWSRRDFRISTLFLLPGVAGATVMLGLGRNLWPRFFFFLGGFILLIVVRGAFAIARFVAERLTPDDRARTERRLLAAGSAVMLLGWAAILPRAYALPKQDYEGAKAYVEAERRPGDAVLTAGLTQMPYARYYDTDYVPIDTVEALDAAVAGAERALVLHTLPAFLASRHPELFEALSVRAKEVARFPGSVGGGDLVVFEVR